ncbi:hypothetical protein [Yoonia sediminilitoris]|uniref:Uncharacterized protein n=1 Tax=Yoonia sediminilitoris TaxID=1286148 RepID=A0A2T6KMM5_9RHOB|nr:hypothetical protein [Yoonia sediminilitoris]PUB17456.1 hypothetical protein C8N45_102468 [Yoonia sediminilitoris]RCW97751.1 hypothetical protein DFP92_102468 [Yoonia sediminilitoris]
MTLSAARNIAADVQIQAKPAIAAALVVTARVGRQRIADHALLATARPFETTLHTADLTGNRIKAMQ